MYPSTLPVSDKPLLIVSTESVRVAADKLAGPIYEVITYKQAKDDQIRGKHILIWPETDKSALGMAQRFAKIAREVKAIITSGESPGWNAIQAVKDGWTFEQLVAWAKPRAVPVGPIQIEVTDGDVPKPTPSQYATLEKLGLAMPNGKLVGDLANVCRFLERSEYADRIWYDEFYKRCFATSEEEPRHMWTDFDTLKLTDHLQQNIGFRKLSDDVVDKAIHLHAQRNPRNEPREWMESLHWDGKERIHSFFSEFMGAESSEYCKAVGHNFWVSMAARIYKPGCQMDHMVVLEGPQNAGKTSALRIIGGEWYVEASQSVQSNDFFMVLNGRLLVEIAELDAFSRAEVNRIKQVISCPVDSYRVPYAHREADHPRTSIFVGTTNDDSYLKDATGGRRFWPMKCGKIDLDGIRATRDQLFAEAVDCFKSGNLWHITPEEQTKQIQESRRQGDEWEDILMRELSALSRVTVAEAAALVKVTVDKLDMRTQHRIGKCLRRAGFFKKVLKNSGEDQKTWVKE